MLSKEIKLKFLKLLVITSVVLIPFYFFRFEIFTIPTNIFEFSLLLSLLSFVIFAISFRRKLIFGPPWPYLLLIFAGISVYFATDTISALGILKGWFIVPAILYLLIINIFKEDDIKYLSLALFISLIIVSTWAIIQHFGVITTLFYQKNDPSFGQYLNEHLRVFGPFESPNYLAMFLVPVLFLSLPAYNSLKYNFSKAAFVVGLILPLFAIWYSGSRAGILAFIFSAVIFSIFKINKKFEISNFLLSALIILMLVALAYYFVVIQFNPSSDQVRIEIYKYSIELIRSNWVFGIGLGGFREAISNITSNVDSFRTHALPYALHPHNIFLAFWLNTGSAGLLLFLVVVIFFITNIFKNKKRDLIFASLMLTISVIIIHGMFDTTYFKNDLSALFWLLLAIGYIYNPIKNKQ